MHLLLRGLKRCVGSRPRWDGRIGLKWRWCNVLLCLPLLATCFSSTFAFSLSLALLSPRTFAPCAPAWMFLLRRLLLLPKGIAFCVPIVRSCIVLGSLGPKPFAYREMDMNLFVEVPTRAPPWVGLRRIRHGICNQLNESIVL